MERNDGAWARGGAVLSAALASVCCILPLGLGVLGLSTTAVAAFFEPLRPWFLALAALLLGVGFLFRLQNKQYDVLEIKTYNSVNFDRVSW